MKKRLLYKFGLEGFISDVNEIRLTDNLIIKKFNLEDKEIFYGKMGDKWINESYKSLLKHDYFLEYHTEVTIPMKPDDLEGDSKIITSFRVLFRLFKEGNLDLRFFQKYISPMDEDDYQSLGFVMIYSSYRNYSSPYQIEKKEATALKEFTNSYIHLNKNNNKVIHIAAKRLNYSYSRQDSEDKIIDLMIGFECLFLKENNEVSYRLALRTAKFLNNKDPKEVFTFIKKAYDLRSKIVHGADTKKIEIKIGLLSYKEEIIIIMLKDYLRIALLKYVKLYSNKSHDDFITELDETIIS